MSRLSVAHRRWRSSSSLLSEAEAAGYALAGFQEASDRRRAGRVSTALVLASIMTPLSLAIAALVYIGLNI